MVERFTWVQLILYTVVGTAVVLVVGFGLLVMNFVQMRNELVEWPPLTMYYDRETRSEGQSFLTKMRLDHNSPDSWTQEVIKGRVYDTRWGNI